MDADFCAQFIKVLHTQGTPGFHTIGCYNKVCYLLSLLRMLIFLSSLSFWETTSKLFFSPVASMKPVTMVGLTLVD